MAAKKKITPYRRRQRRLLLLGIVFPAFAGATALALVAISQTEVYFYAPSALLAETELGPREIRLGGMVEGGSLKPLQGSGVTFTVTDGAASVPVIFNDVLPGLVAEGDGVVAQGRMGDDGVFLASTVLARHDENYMAPEVADALKDAGTYEQFIPADQY